MSLLDDLREIEHFPPSHLPTVAEVLQVVGVLVAYVEHGDELLQAVKADAEARDAGEPATHVGELLSPPEQPEQQPQASQGSAASPPGAPAATAAAGAPDDRDARIRELEQQLAASEPDPRDARIAELEQQLATKRATEQRTQVEFNPAEPPREPDTSEPDKGSW